MYLVWPLIWYLYNQKIKGSIFAQLTGQTCHFIGLCCFLSKICTTWQLQITVSVFFLFIFFSLTDSSAWLYEACLTPINQTLKTTEVDIPWNTLECSKNATICRENLWAVAFIWRYCVFKQLPGKTYPVYVSFLTL